jgi:PST family polysaccharide transporter
VEKLENKKHHHKEILGTSFFTGGAQAVTTATNLIRVKFVAVFLGVAGFGLAALLLQASTLIQTITGMGIGSAGVRAIAAANGKGDIDELGKIYNSIRAWSWVLGLLNLFVCVLFSEQLSQITFGSDSYRSDFMLIGLAAFLNQISMGQMAILRGMRKIKDIALRTIRGAIIGLILTIPLYYFFGSKAIAPAIVLVALINLILSWLGVREYRNLYKSEIFLTALKNGKGLFHTGLGFIGTAIAGTLATYLISLIIRNEQKIDGNGYYQAASGITLVLVNFILAAMGQDYYPKLSSLIHDKEKACHLIGAQVETALLLAAPILIGVSTMSPWLIKLAYTDKFLSISSIITWLALSCIGRIISWPLGFTLLAEGNPIWILASEIPANILIVAMAWTGIHFWGLPGVAAAWAVFYLIYWLALSVYVHRRLGYVTEGRQLSLIFSIMMLTGLGFWTNPWVGLCLTIITSIYCLKKIVTIINPENRFIIWMNNHPLLHKFIKNKN